MKTIKKPFKSSRYSWHTQYIVQTSSKSWECSVTIKIKKIIMVVVVLKISLLDKHVKLLDKYALLAFRVLEFMFEALSM